MAATEIGTRTALENAAAGWVFFHHLFRFPTPEQWQWLHEERVALAWEALAGRPLPLPEHYADYQEQYLSTFEVGAPEPPCPLVESHWNKREPVPRVLHENILFYQHFGLRLRASANETADHLRHQLEFMHHLCRLEMEPSPPPGIAAARRDYLRRHLASWIGRAAQELTKEQPDHWCTAWMAVLAAWCEDAGLASEEIQDGVDERERMGWAAGNEEVDRNGLEHPAVDLG